MRPTTSPRRTEETLGSRPLGLGLAFQEGRGSMVKGCFRPVSVRLATLMMIWLRRRGMGNASHYRRAAYLGLDKHYRSSPGCRYVRGRRVGPRSGELSSTEIDLFAHSALHCARSRKPTTWPTWRRTKGCTPRCSDLSNITLDGTTGIVRKLILSASLESSHSAALSVYEV